MAAMEEKPRVLVLGGTGFIGRNFVQYLVKHELASKIRVADKVPPAMAWMNKQHQEVFSSPYVEFKHSNLINPVSVSNAFTDDSGDFDYVVNLAAETKYGQSDAVYKEGIVKLSITCAEEAAKRNVKSYVEVSSGQMYSSDKKPAKEDSKTEPWTNMACHKLEVERLLQDVENLKYAIIRPGIVYGLGDKSGLAPRLIIGAIYRYIKQKMKMLWTKDLKMNTVYVHDVCRAIWHVLCLGKTGEIYNCVDEGDTTQGRISELVSEVYGISYEFVGSIMSNIARINMSSVVEDINEKHVAPWAEACTRDHLKNTPLTPFIDQELLYNKNLYLNGTKLEETGFKFERPNLQAEHLKEILNDYVSMGIFPSSLLSEEAICKEIYEEVQNGNMEDLNELENLQLEDDKSQLS